MAKASCVRARVRVLPGFMKGASRTQIVLIPAAHYPMIHAVNPDPRVPVANPLGADQVRSTQGARLDLRVGGTEEPGAAGPL